MQDQAPIAGFVDFTRRITGALTYVRSANTELAGSPQPHGFSQCGGPRLFGKRRFGGLLGSCGIAAGDPSANPLDENGSLHLGGRPMFGNVDISSQRAGAEGPQVDARRAVLARAE